MSYSQNKILKKIKAMPQHKSPQNHFIYFHLIKRSICEQKEQNRSFNKLTRARIS